MGRPWEILHGDVRRVCKTLEVNSFDACLCDPPYGLSFMGRRWDYSVPSALLWSEVERVLKPGAHAMIFGGSRTFHRTVVAAEDGGLIPRDLLFWLYGCLTDDAEILTEHGWKRGIDVEVGERVASWDPTDESIRLSEVEAKTLEPYKGKLVHFVNDDTDQLLTPNHRVYHRAHEREQVDGVRRTAWSSWRVLEAGDINRWQAIRLPLGGFHDGLGIGGEDYAALLGWIWTEGHFDNTGNGVRIYQSPSANAAKCEEIESLVTRMGFEPRRYYRERIYRYKETEREVSEKTWFFTGEMATLVREDLPGKHPTWDLLWRMTLAEKRAFWDAAMKGDGSGDDFYQKDEADLEWAQALVGLIGWRGKLVMRKPPRDGGSVCITKRATTELQARHLKATPVAYDGMVWCVKVATGAFVARRAGKIFITGNSGFPKSHDASKAIDKLAGVEREVVGHKVTGRAYTTKESDVRFNGGQKEVGVTAPATEEAEDWYGFGTALKPSYEPILLARKMLDGTVAENALKWGAGAIAIDAARIGESGGTSYTRTGPKAGLFGVGGRGIIADIGAGRWPTNVILSHLDECELVGHRPSNDVATKTKSTGKVVSENVAMGGANYGPTVVGRSERPDEEVWTCAPGCPVRMLDEQSEGVSRFFYTAKADRYQREAGLEKKKAVLKGADALRDGGRTATTSANTHPTVKPIDLIRYLAALILPPKRDTPRRILVPFSGVASEMIGCMQAGWDEVVGIEREAEYIEIAKARITGGGVLSGLMDRKLRRRKAR